MSSVCTICSLHLQNWLHDDVIKWKLFPRYWSVTRSFDVFFWYASEVNGWVNNHEAGDLRRYRAHYDVTVMCEWRTIHQTQSAGSWFNIKIPSYPYRKYQCGDKTILRSSYLHNGNAYTGTMVFLYWSACWVISSSSCCPGHMSVWSLALSRRQSFAGNILILMCWCDGHGTQHADGI